MLGRRIYRRLAASWPRGAQLAVSLAYVAVMTVGLVGSAATMSRRVHDGQTVPGLRLL